MEINNEQYEKLVILARRALHTAYVWNDHNFECARKIAEKTAKSVGINSFDDANNFIDSLPVEYGCKLCNVATGCDGSC